ncbi:MAG: hypothetical protein ACR2JU_05425 [Nocardioidaceae bacterium]
MRKIAAGAISAVLTVFVGGLPAAAQTQTYLDRDGGPGTAIQSVTVENGSQALRVTMKHKRVLHKEVVWIDTRASDPGPEYRVSFLANSDSLSFRRVESFQTGAGKPWACSNAEAHSDNFAPGANFWIKIPQGCLNGPGKVRVQTRSSNANDVRDMAPNKGKYGPAWFTPWVPQG